MQRINVTTTVSNLLKAAPDVREEALAAATANDLKTLKLCVCTVNGLRVDGTSLLLAQLNEVAVNLRGSQSTVPQKSRQVSVEYLETLEAKAQVLDEVKTLVRHHLCDGQVTAGPITDKLVAAFDELSVLRSERALMRNRVDELHRQLHTALD